MPDAEERNAELVLERAYLDWQNEDGPSDYTEGMSFGEFAVARLAKAVRFVRAEVVALDIEIATAIAGTATEPSRADFSHGSSYAEAMFAERTLTPEDEEKVADLIDRRPNPTDAFDAIVGILADLAETGFIERWSQTKVTGDSKVWLIPEPFHALVIGELTERGRVTKTGRILTNGDLDRLADEAEIGYDVSHLKDKPGSRED